MAEGTNRCREGDQSEWPAGKRRPGMLADEGNGRNLMLVKKSLCFSVDLNKDGGVLQHLVLLLCEGRPGGSY